MSCRFRSQPVRRTAISLQLVNDLTQLLYLFFILKFAFLIYPAVSSFTGFMFCLNSMMLSHRFSSCSNFFHYTFLNLNLCPTASLMSVLNFHARSNGQHLFYTLPLFLPYDKCVPFFFIPISKSFLLFFLLLHAWSMQPLSM